MGLLHARYRFILLPSFLGLLCYGCNTTVASVKETASFQADTTAVSTEPSEPTEPTEPTEPSESGSVASPQDNSESAAAYREAINLASSAHKLSQEATSPDDWGLVASRWQRAAKRLKSVSTGDPNYQTAQQKSVEYAHYAQGAMARVAELQKPAEVSRLPVPSPVSSPVPAAANRPALPTDRALLPVTAIAQSDPSDQSAVRVPIVRRLHGTPVINVTFNGEKSYEMILDTGASRTLITRQMASELSVVATERMVAATASHAEVIFDIGRMQSISVGNITLTGASVSIGESIEVGLLGNDFLRGYDVTIRDRTNVVELTAAN